MSSKVVVGAVVAVLVIVWLADVGAPSEYAWLALAFVGISLSVVAAYCGVFFGLVWLWGSSHYARIAMLGGAGVLAALWFVGMVAGQFDRGPLDCGGPTMGGYVC